MHFAGFLTEFFWRPEAVSPPSPVQSPIAPSRALTHKTIRKPRRLEPHWQAAKAKSGRTWLLQVAKVATVLIAINTAWVEGSRARAAAGTETAAAKQSSKLTGTTLPSQAAIEQVQVIGAGQQVQVRVEGAGHLWYVPSGLSHPDRLVLDFRGALLRMEQKVIPSDWPPVRRVRVGQFKVHVARVVIDLDAQVPYSISANENVVTVVLRPDVLAGTRAGSAQESAKPFVAPAVPAEAGVPPVEPTPLAAPVAAPKPGEYKRTEVEPAKKSSLETKAETPPETTAPGPGAQDSVGGHFGVAFPLFTRAQGKTTTLGDKFVVAFPMGITIKPKGESSPLLFDLELVPAVQPAPREVNLTIHPGILKPLRHHFVAGVRAAFDVGQSSWGFTPLIARSFPVGEHKNNRWFVELDLPVRWQKPSTTTVRSVSLVLHVGTTF